MRRREEVTSRSGQLKGRGLETWTCCVRGMAAKRQLWGLWGPGSNERKPASGGECGERPIPTPAPQRPRMRICLQTARK